MEPNHYLIEAVLQNTNEMSFWVATYRYKTPKYFLVQVKHTCAMGRCWGKSLMDFASTPRDQWQYLLKMAKISSTDFSTQALAQL